MAVCEDERIWGTLLARLRRRAVRLGVPRGDAEDLAQETILRLMQRHAHGPLDAPEHYAMVILHNLARARWRARVEMTELDEDCALTLPEAHGRIALAQMAQAIRALPEGQARIMQMVLEGETRPAAIACALDLPLGTVMSRLARARASLRAQAGLGAQTPVSELL